MGRETQGSSKGRWEVSASQELGWAKDRATKALVDLTRGIERNESPSTLEMAGAIDALNRAWDKLTDILVAQRDERGRVVLRLLDELAEEKVKR